MVEASMTELFVLSFCFEGSFIGHIHVRHYTECLTDISP